MKRELGPWGPLWCFISMGKMCWHPPSEEKARQLWSNCPASHISGTTDWPKLCLGSLEPLCPVFSIRSQWDSIPVSIHLGQGEAMSQNGIIPSLPETSHSWSRPHVLTVITTSRILIDLFLKLCGIRKCPHLNQGLGRTDCFISLPFPSLAGACLLSYLLSPPRAKDLHSTLRVLSTPSFMARHLFSA